MCFGCKDESGHKILSNGTWKKDDCTSCNCNQFGQLSCDTQMCKVNFEQPTKIERQCCPLCKGMHDLQLNYIWFGHGVYRREQWY